MDWFAILGLPLVKSRRNKAGKEGLHRQDRYSPEKGLTWEIPTSGIFLQAVGEIMVSILQG